VLLIIVVEQGNKNRRIVSYLISMQVIKSAW